MVQARIIIFFFCLVFFWVKEFTHKAVCFTMVIHWKITPGLGEYLSERISL